MLGDVESMKMEISVKQRELSEKNKAISNLKKELDKLDNDNGLKVSEHAMLRYFERVLGYDISAIEQKILSEKVVDLVEKLGGNGTYPNDGFSVVMKNFTVITLIK